MKAELFFHGKPNNYDSWSRRLFDGLEERIGQEYFSAVKDLPNSGYVVETRQWKGLRYSVYSYCLTEDVKDTSSRPSYCVLSLIFQGEYCLRSYDLFDLLSQTYERKIVGEAKVMADNGNYVSDWLNTYENRFVEIESAVLNCLENQFSGMFSVIDQAFSTSLPAFSDKKKVAQYNPEDCDSEAYFSALRRYARIIVSKTFKAKDSIIASLDGIAYAASENEKLHEQLVSLQKTLSQKDDDLSDAIASGRKLESEVTSLKEVNRNLQRKLAKADADVDRAVNKLDSRVSKIGEDIDGARRNCLNSVEGWRKIIAYVPVLNLLLLALLIFLCHVGFKGVEFKKKDDIKTVSDTLLQKWQTSAEYYKSLFKLYSNSISKGEDVSKTQPNCIMSICRWSNGQLQSLSGSDKVSLGDTLYLHVNDWYSNYKWLKDPVAFAPECQLPTFMWIVDSQSCRNEKITISYRNPNSNNETLNKIELCVKQ